MASWTAALPLARGRRRPAARAVGIVANEFFDRSLGRMGGFGWAARASAESLAPAASRGRRPVLLAGKGGLGSGRPERHESGIPLVRFDDRRRYGRRLGRLGIGLLLTIDYRPNYRPVLTACDVPVIVWVRDPRTPDDIARIATLVLPSGKVPEGVQAIDCLSLGTHVETARGGCATIVFASPAPLLATPRMHTTYGVDHPDVHFLPNPVPPARADVPKTARPSVVFLGRLDPIKRPWVFVELARRFPRVEFLMLGGRHFSGPGSWSPGRLPSNVSLLGHVDGEHKRRILGSAWILANTSIHESLPVSFLEALHSATPIVSCQDPEAVTSRFGSYVGHWDGSGLDAVDAFAEGTERLLEDHELRETLGVSGRDWAVAHHTPEQFAQAFGRLADSLAA